MTGEWTRRKLISVMLEEEDRMKVLEICEREERSRASVVRRLVHQALMQEELVSPSDVGRARDS